MTVAPIEDTALITFSAAAAAKLLEIMNEKGLSDAYALRVFVSGGGCSGLQYGMAFDENPRPIDTVFEQHGLRVVVDPNSLPYLVGANIDYVENALGSGFQIDNPNAVSGCNCGSAGSGCSSCR
ncbi:MAG: iron-sulfur cluster assembly accessory protein [Anaerolineae bacterium]